MALESIESYLARLDMMDACSNPDGTLFSSPENDALNVLKVGTAQWVDTFVGLPKDVQRKLLYAQYKHHVDDLMENYRITLSPAAAAHLRRLIEADYLGKLGPDAGILQQFFLTRYQVDIDSLPVLFVPSNATALEKCAMDIQNRNFFYAFGRYIMYIEDTGIDRLYVIPKREDGVREIYNFFSQF